LDTSIQETQATNVKPDRARRVRARQRWLIPVAVLICVLILLPAIFSSAILAALGAFLVHSGQPQTADIILVIGGDYTGERILKAAELERDGYAPTVFVSGGGSMYGFHEAELAVAFVQDHGYTAEKFIQFRYPASSTVDEAMHVIPELRAIGVHRYLLVTSPEHTARAGRVFRRVAPDLDVRVVAAPSPVWNGGRWWATREGRKTWLMEASKTVADWFRL
jgi:uncharacterized SAM-binding protein YcdF (DUF218 family)